MAGCRPADSPTRAIKFLSGDKRSIPATIYTPREKHPPGLILLHAAGETREAWAAFADLARTRGYLSIAIDLRGHGESKAAGPATANPSTFTGADWLAILPDIAGAKQQLLQAGADPDRLAIVGASIGANLALVYAETDPAIQALVLLSPGEKYRGIAAGPAMEKFRGRPVLIMAALGDDYAASSAKALDAIAASKQLCELRLFSGAAHGTNLLAAQPISADQILFWLDQMLGQAKPSASN